MRALDFLVQPRLPPSLSLAHDAYFLHAVTAASSTRKPVLRVYDMPGDVISLGRYHLAPTQSDSALEPRLYRRHSGGRAVPFGQGFVGVALALPHRAALVSPDPCALAPHQVLNRYVRGILDACKLLGLEAFYPGRDLVTAGGRVLGLISFEVDGLGAMLFEAILANHRDFSILPLLLDAADRAGVIKAEMPNPDQMTCIERELGKALDLEDLAELLRRGYERHFNLSIVTYAPAAPERTGINSMAADRFEGDHWLRQRQLPTGPWRYAATRVQLGVFEAYVDFTHGGMREVRLAGDFIANSPAIDQLERDLRSCHPEWHAVDAVVSRVFAEPGNFILGIGKLRTIADTIMRALAT
jgi:lipoate-protein ligase A